MRSNHWCLESQKRENRKWAQRWNAAKSALLLYNTWLLDLRIVIMSEEQDQNKSLIDESDNDSEPAVHHQMNPRVEAKINALCQQTGLVMKQVIIFPGAFN